MKIVRRQWHDDGSLDGTVDDPVLKKILLSRGIANPCDLDLSLKQMLHYKDLKDIDAAAQAITDAIIKGEHIMIMGDYDVDGLTGTALGVLCLKSFLHKQISYQIPSRYDTGYGLSCAMVDKAKALNVDLIVTVDNGISCFEAASHAKKLGIKLVITDHHEPAAMLPDALAVVDPKRSDCAFKSKNLCGAGVLFYVLIAVRARLVELGWFKGQVPAMGKFLDLVAIGTVGDVVALDANNRRLVKAGLDRMHKSSAQLGIKALAEISRVNLNMLTTANIAFDLCPRLNAAGRIKLKDNPSIECLLSSSTEHARELAGRLDMINRRRGDYERVFLAEAKEEAKLIDHNHSICVFKEHWLTGVAGLIASRLKDSYQQPCFVFAGTDSEITGSGRSIPGFPLAKILGQIEQEHPGLLLRYGGHAMAAGATIKKERFPDFKEAFDQKAKDFLTGAGQEHEYETDGELSPDRFKIDFARKLEQLGPWGQGCPEPAFDGVFEIADMRLLGQRNLRFKLTSDDFSFYAIRFRASAKEKSLMPGMKVRVIFSLQVDRYYQNERLEVVVKFIEPL